MRRLVSLLLFAAVGVAAQPVTVYLELGDEASAVEPWDGSIEVRGGQLLRLETRHFGADDRLTGPAAWEAKTRREQINGFPRVNYNEMSPANLPPTQFSPVGLHATIDPGGAAEVRVKTAQGDFSFVLSELGKDARTFLGAIQRLDAHRGGRPLCRPYDRSPGPGAGASRCRGHER